MPKIKLTKGELKKERDNLKQYRRYLPTLQLKKQQLQIEILKYTSALEDKAANEREAFRAVLVWAGLLSDNEIDIRAWLKPSEITIGSRNVAGVDLPVFEKVLYPKAEYDLFASPLWVDSAIDTLRKIVSIREEIALIRKGIGILRQELRVTTQRVNLFEKVKIPEAEEAIRLIKIYIGDQMTNAVGRSKIAKRKIEAVEMEEALV